jgi:hypothetical protein
MGGDVIMRPGSSEQAFSFTAIMPSKRVRSLLRSTLMTDSTVPSHPIPSVVIVSPASDVLDKLLDVLQRLDEVPSVQLTGIEDVATAVAKWRPLALFVQREVFDFDADEFRALGRDVGAEVVTLDASAGRETMAEAILPTLRAALVRWRAANEPGG